MNLDYQIILRDWLYRYSEFGKVFQYIEKKCFLLIRNPRCYYLLSQGTNGNFIHTNLWTKMVMLLLPLSDMKHLFDFKRLLGHLVQGCVIVLTRHLLHIDTIITLLWQSGLSWLWFVWNLLVHILYIGNMFVSGIALMRNESPKHVSNSCPHALFQNLIRNQWNKKILL